MTASVFAPEIPKSYLLLAKTAAGCSRVREASRIADGCPYAWGLLEQHKRALELSIATTGDPARYCNAVGSEDAPADQSDLIENAIAEIGKIIADPQGYEHRHLEFESDMFDLLSGKDL